MTGQPQFARLRRGLTLVEVVAATVLLAVLAAAVVPIVRQARADLDRPVAPGLADAFGTRTPSTAHLTDLAARLARHPERYGLEGLRDPSRAIDLILDATHTADFPPVRVRREDARVELGSGRDEAPPADGSAERSQPLTGAWLRVESAGIEVVRWVPLDDTPRAPTPAGPARRGRAR